LRFTNYDFSFLKMSLLLFTLSDPNRLNRVVVAFLVRSVVPFLQLPRPLGTSIGVTSIVAMFHMVFLRSSSYFGVCEISSPLGPQCPRAPFPPNSIKFLFFILQAPPPWRYDPFLPPPLPPFLLPIFERLPSYCPRRNRPWPSAQFLLGGGPPPSFFAFAINFFMVFPEGPSLSLKMF